MQYSRYAIYCLPTSPDLAEFGARWLGHDVLSGQARDQFEVPDLAGVTNTPRKYGFHATLKAPFRLAEGCSVDGLIAAAAQLAANTPKAICDGLVVARLGRFLALVLAGDEEPANRLAASCVTGLDRFRAPMSPEERARRAPHQLTARRLELLDRWGYPHVLEQFRFHMTLTGKLPRSVAEDWHRCLVAHLPALPDPFVIDRISLVGERPDGRFECLEHFALAAAKGGSEH